MSAKRERETPEVAAGVRRMIRALGKRVGNGDPVDLVELAAVIQEADAALRAAVAMQKAGTEWRAGYSWAEIAEGLGTSRQAAQERFGRAGQIAS